MADVERQCSKCSAKVTVSEVADSFVCPECGTRAETTSGGEAAAASLASAGSKLKLREEAPSDSIIRPLDELLEEAEARERAGGEITDEIDPEHPLRPQARKQSTAMSSLYQACSWLLFLALGSLMGWLRYGDVLPANYLAQFRAWSPFIFFFIHVVIVLSAFNDTVFSGILSLLMPPYAYYYLFSVCDSFYLRAGIAGVLVGIGADSGIYIEQKVSFAIEWVNAYIAAGGW